jgi:hypothetical protein
LRHLAFYRLMQHGLYFHPSTECVRTWGFVGTVVEQIQQLLTLPAEKVHRRTLYVGDAPMPLRDISNAFSRGLRGRDVRVVPSWLVKSAARAGDVARSLWIPFPLHSARYRSMTQDYVVEMQPTWDLLGPPVFTIDDGVRAVKDWLAYYGSRTGDWQPLSPPGFRTGFEISESNARSPHDARGSIRSTRGSRAFSSTSKAT